MKTSFHKFMASNAVNKFELASIKDIQDSANKILSQKNRAKSLEVQFANIKNDVKKLYEEVYTENQKLRKLNEDVTKAFKDLGMPYIPSKESVEANRFVTKDIEGLLEYVIK